MRKKKIIIISVVAVISIFAIATIVYIIMNHSNKATEKDTLDKMILHSSKEQVTNNFGKADNDTNMRYTYNSVEVSGYNGAFEARFLDDKVISYTWESDIYTEIELNDILKCLGNKYGACESETSKATKSTSYSFNANNEDIFVMKTLSEIDGKSHDTIQIHISSN